MRALIFPGQSDQKKGMGKDLFDLYPNVLDEADEILEYSIRDICLKNKYNELNQTLYIQPAIYTVNFLSYLQQNELMSPPDYLAGHGIGEYNALLAAMVFDFKTGLHLVKKRAEAMSAAKNGAMAAVIGLSHTQITDIIKQENYSDIVIANYNTETYFVLSGSKKNISALGKILSVKKGVGLFLIVKNSDAFHSRHMNIAAQEFSSFISNFNFFSPKIPVISNATAEPYDVDTIKDLLVRQITSPVNWLDTIQYLRYHGVTEFIEIGKSNVLTGMINEICKEPLLEYYVSPASGNTFTLKNIDYPQDNSVNDKTSPLLSLIIKQCKKYPQKNLQSFYINGQWKMLSGAEILRKLVLLGTALQNILASREKVILILPQGPDFCSAILSCWHASATVIPTPVIDESHFIQKKSGIDSIIQNSGAKYIITNDEFEKNVTLLAEENSLIVININALLRKNLIEELPISECRALTENDLAVILYTSGATSHPKGVMLSHKALFHTATSSLWGMSDTSVVTSWLPQFHAFGISFGLLTPLAHGCENIITTPDEFIRDPLIWFTLIDQFKATHTGAPNFAFDYCRTHINENACSNLRLDSLESLVCGGDMIHHLSYNEFQQKFSFTGLHKNTLTPNYGMSEAGPLTLKKKGEPYTCLSIDKDYFVNHDQVVASSAENAKVVVSCGITDQNTKILIVNSDTTTECMENQVGEIWIKSPCQASGYLNNEKETNITFNNCLNNTNQCGFLRTGDLGFLHGDELYIVGRKKEVIIINGKNYYPKDLENLLRDNIEACFLRNAIFSTRQDAKENVIVLQEIEKNSDEMVLPGLAEEIIAVISSAYAIHVQDVVFIEKDQLPVTGSKKTQRMACKEQYEKNILKYIWKYSANTYQENFTGKAGYTNNIHILRLLQDVFYPELGSVANRITPDLALGTLGLDSILYIRLAQRISDHFAVSFKPGLFLKYSSLEKIAGYLEEFSVSQAKPQVTNQYLSYKDPSIIALLQKCKDGKASISQTIKVIKEYI